MNANNWPIERVRRIEFEVPLPLAECMRRVDRLNEPQLVPRPLFFSKKQRLWRTAVRRDVRFLGQVQYNIAILFITDPYTTETASDEVRLKLLPLAYTTRVIITYPEKWQVPNRVKGIVSKILGGITIVLMLILIVANAIGNLVFRPLCYLTMLGLMLALMVGVNDYRRRTWQQEALLKQMHKVFGVAYNSHVVLERRKSKSS